MYCFLFISVLHEIRRLRTIKQSLLSILFLFFNFTLFLKHSKLDRGNFVALGKGTPFPLSHLRFPLFAEFWKYCILCNLTPCFTLFLVTEWENENIKYFISSSWTRTHYLSHLQSHTCPLAPQRASIYISSIHYL